MSPLDYGCCLTFFATVTCGPITRVEELAPLISPASALFLGWAGCRAVLLFSGLGEKVLLAGIFRQWRRLWLCQSRHAVPMDSALTILCYTLQIYFDFSGYCDMARDGRDDGDLFAGESQQPLSGSIHPGLFGALAYNPFPVFFASVSISRWVEAAVGCGSPAGIL